MKKYLHVISIAVQNNLTYRVNLLARILLGFIPLLAMLYLWRTIYAGKGGADVGDYTLSQMISYYLMARVVDALTAVHDDDWQIAADIREGNISQFLLKPLNYFLYRLSTFCAGRILYTAMAAVPVGLFIWWHREHFVGPPDGWHLVAFGVSVGLTALLQFIISYAMALLAFWVLEVSTFIFILYAFEYLASGHLFPLDILPPALQQALVWTPFPYQLYFPVSIYLGKTTGPELIQGLCVQAAWVGITYGLAQWIWRQGIRRYAAYGG